MEYFSHLWPDFLIQFTLGCFLLFVFAPSSKLEDSPSGGQMLFRCALVSLGMLALSLTIEHHISPYFFQGTLVIQWVFFTLLGHQFCRIPLGKSMLAQFCFFSMMLGAGLIKEDFHSLVPANTWTRNQELAPSLESSEPAPLAVWARHADDALLTNLLPEIRNDVRILVYGPPPVTSSPPPPTPRPTPSPKPASADTPIIDLPAQQDPTSQPIPPTPIPPDVQEPPIPPQEVPPPDAITSWDEIPDEPAGAPIFMEGDNTIRSGQMREITEVKNRSTDRSYAPPTYEIDAVSVGENGRFVMLNGRLLREGAILKTGGLEPRGWKLFKVTQTELFWQPLE